MKSITLTQGLCALVDDEDYEDLIQHRWYAHNNGHCYYAVRTVYGVSSADRRREYMHRRIMRVTGRHQIVDHIASKETLNNTKANLRIATPSENHMNSRMNRRNTSGYRGVRWHKFKCLWQARISKDKKEIHLGYFSDKKKAAGAYNKAAKELFGAFARLNEVSE